MRRNVLLLRDYFVYKDMYNPSAKWRRQLLSGIGRPGQDAFLLLALALEARARALGRLRASGEDEDARRIRIRKMLGWPDDPSGVLPALPAPA